MSQNIPVIDLAPIFSGFTEGKQQVAAEVGRALETVGFFYISGHDVPEELVRQLRDALHLSEGVVALRRVVAEDEQEHLGLLRGAVLLDRLPRGAQRSPLASSFRAVGNRAP